MRVTDRPKQRTVHVCHPCLEEMESWLIPDVAVLLHSRSWAGVIVQELAAIKETAAQLDTARSVIESQTAEHVAALTDSQREAETARATLADRERLIDELQSQLAATVAERDQALSCVSSMQDTVRSLAMLCS